MAGDWIKMRPSLLTSPKVNGIARILEESKEVSGSLSTGLHGHMSEIVTRNVMRNVTVASLLVIWGAANEHTEDGIFHNADFSDIDDMVGIPGFGEAMEIVGWAEYDPENCSVILPNFKEYNTCSSERSCSAKTNAERQKEYRERKKLQESNVTNVTESNVTSNRREEKRREDIQTTNVVCKRAAQLPGDFAPNQAHIDFAGNNALSISEEFAKFSDYHKAKGSTMKDWDAALRTWLRNAVEFAKKHTSNQSKSDKLKTVTDELTGRGKHGSAVALG